MPERFAGTNTLLNVQRAVNRRYGPSSNVEEFVRKAQLAHYENTRAQFENLCGQRLGQPQDDPLLDVK